MTTTYIGIYLHAVEHAAKNLHLRYAQNHPNPDEDSSRAPTLITTNNKTDVDYPPLPHLLPMMPPDTISTQTPNPTPKTDSVSKNHIHSLNNNPTNLPLIHPCNTPSLYDSLNSFDVINLYRIFGYLCFCNQNTLYLPLRMAISSTPEN